MANVDPKGDFPRYLYKKGTGKAVNDQGLYTADSRLVQTAEEFAALGGDWCSSPAEAAGVAAPRKAEPAPAPLKVDPEPAPALAEETKPADDKYSFGKKGK